MATITPTYDFGVNEVPTRETLLQQARSLEITDLDLGDLGANFLPILSGGTSGATGAIIDAESLAGTMWIDGSGNVWVQEQSGPVMLYRFHGGWETRRYFVIKETGTPNVLLPGYPIAQYVGGPDEDTDRFYGASNPTDSATIWRHDDESMDDNDAGRINGILQETATSNYARVCGRGLTILRDQATGIQVTIASMRRNYRMYRNTTGTTYTKESFHGTLMTNSRWQGYILSPAASSSVASNAGGNHNVHLIFMAWNFGVFQRGKKDYQ